MSLQAQIAGFTSTENWYKHHFGINYTDGIKFVAEKYGAYWLIDAIASQQSKVKGEGFQVWKLEVVQEIATAVLTCRADIDLPALVTQKIEYTDFPETIEIYLVDTTLMLKSEY